MASQYSADKSVVSKNKFFYGWVVVAACALMLTITYGLMYSYSVFFKPLSDYFHWDRATVSLVYSASIIIRGGISIGIGWLADRFGARKLMIFCGIMIAVGLLLSSQAHNLLQFFLTYAILLSFGLSGAFGIGTAMVSRWFPSPSNRGLALGLVSTGSGLGTLFIVPGNEQLVSAVGWSEAFIICGIIAGVSIIALALLLKNSPKPVTVSAENIQSERKVLQQPVSNPDVTLGQAIKDSRMLVLLAAFFLFFFGIQIIMVHLVAYATDTGINSLVAATLISIVGLVSIFGRLGLGAGSEKFGMHRALILTSILLIVSFVWLIFSRSLWSFYVFAIIFGIPYGGEVPQIPLFIGKYFGTKSLAALVGLSQFVLNTGGAIGSWAAGKIFDTTQSYQWALISGAIAAFGSLILVLVLQRQSKTAKQAIE
jgi:MFS family permease